MSSTPPAWALVLLVGAVLSAAFVALPDRDDRGGAALYAVAAVAPVVLAAAVLLRRGLLRHGLWPLLLLGGVGVHALGEVGWVVDTWSGRRAPVPAPDDALFLAGYALVLLAVLNLMVRRRSGDLSAVVDALVVTVGLATPAFVFAVVPLLRDTSPARPMARVVPCLYTSLDVTLVALLALVSLTAPWGRRGWRLLFGGLATFLVSDVVLAGQLLHSDLTQARPGDADALWLFGYALVSAALVHPTTPLLAERTRPARDGLGVLVLLGLTAAALCAPVTSLVAQARGQAVPYFTSCASIILLLLVLTRLHLMMRHSEAQRQQLAVLARRDSLTGLANRRSFDFALLRAMEDAREVGGPLSVAMIDLDHFKRFNDEHGHKAGDDLLQATARALAQHLEESPDAIAGARRPGDGSGLLLARWGGEEFALLAPGLDARRTTELVDRLRGVMPSSQTFSAGVACWDGDGHPRVLVEAADRALYAAKSGGRDRVVLAAAVPAARTA